MSDAVEKLLQTLQDDWQWHHDLAAVLENKLDAMRHFDITRLEALTQSEQRITQAISLNEKKRREVIRQASAELFPQQGDSLARQEEKTEGRKLVPITARELAGALKPPRRERLLALAGMLREITQKVQTLNRVNSLASHKIMGHFDHIFRIIAQSGRDIGLYGRGGKKSLLEQNRLVDALA